MSYKTQVALGKNTTLQRQLEEKYVEFRRNLKTTRRRLDMLEEECLSVLYKLIVDQSGKEDGSQKNEENKPEQNDKKDPKDTKEPKGAKDGKDPTRAKSAGAKLWRGQAMVDPPLKPSDTSPTPPRRSTTSMSVRDYQKSYSFQVDGLNIDKNRRDRYIRRKKHKEEKQVEIRRGNVHWATKDEFDEDPRPMTTLPEVEDNPEKEEEQARPFTADPYQPSNNKAKLLRRAKLRNTLRPETSLEKEIDNAQAKTFSEESTAQIDETGVRHQDGSSTQTSVPVGDDRSASRLTPQISFKVSVTKLNDMRGPTPTIPENAETPRLQSRVDMNAEEDELIPLDEEDQRHLETIMGDNSADDDRDSRFDMTSRMTSKSGKSSALSKTPSGKSGTGKEGADLVQLATKTQSFLTSYAKKSKLLGYVVKTSSSSAAPRDKTRKTYRSHCVTYQELVSIKANIKQQSSRTRFLLQRSATLTKYVDNLANAGKVRMYTQSLKNQQ